MFQDAERLYKQLNCPKGIHSYNIAHNDFTYGKKVQDLYDNVINIIRHGFSGNGTKSVEF